MPLDAVQSDFDIISRLRGFLTLDAFGLFRHLHELSVIAGAPVLEIGVFCGRSLAALACAFRDTQVVGVDPFYSDFENSPAAPGEAEYLAVGSDHMSPEERIAAFWRIVDRLDETNGTNLKTLIRLERATQDEFLARRLGTEKYQLCHVDAEHTYDAVCGCLDTLDTLLEPGAWLVVDDLLHPGYPDISEAVHTHRGFRTAFWPVFYGLNKGVFIHKPDAKARVSRVKEHLCSIYSSQPQDYLVRRTHDAAPMVQRKPGTLRPPGTKPRARNRLKTRCKSILVRAVHTLIRRGDNAHNPPSMRSFGLVPLDYYYTAADRIASEVAEPHFYVFSDDPDWAQANFRLNFPTTFVTHNDDWRNYEHLRLMNRCRHHIIANSIFSWWGAWLGKKPEQIVYAPRKYYQYLDRPTSDLYPTEWRLV